MSNATSVAMANVYDPSWAERGVVIALGAIAVAVAAYDLHWTVGNFKHIHSLRVATQGIIASVGVFAGANALKAVSPASMVLWVDIIALCKIAFMYFWSIHTLGYFKMGGYGGMVENVQAMGTLMTNANLDLLKTEGPPCCWVCAGKWFHPSTEWAYSCLKRVQIGMLGTFVNGFVVRRVTQSEGVFQAADPDDSGFTTAKFYLGLIDAAFTLYALSGFLPLWGFLAKVILPNNRALVTFRKRLFIVFAPLFGALQPVLIGTVLFGIVLHKSEEWTDHEPTVIAAELVFLQLAMHKAFIPKRVDVEGSAKPTMTWTWWLLRPSLFPMADPTPQMVEAALSGVTFTMSPSEMATVFAPAATSPV